MIGGLVSGSRVTFVGDAMAAVVQGAIEVRELVGRPPVIVGGLAVLSRLSSPYRATVDLDVVDRLLDGVPHLEVLRAADGAKPVEPAAVLLPTPYGAVKVDVLEVRQETLHWVRNVAGSDVTFDDLDLVAELLNAAASLA